MFKRLILSFTFIVASISNVNAQTVTSDSSEFWQRNIKTKLLKSQNLKKWGVPAGNYSGITSLGNNHYALVTDKPKGNGFYEFYIELNDKGKLISAKNLGFRCDSIKKGKRDMEGIVYVPSTNTLFISAEDDQQILEYTLDGQLTGRKLNVPEGFSIKNIQSNYGFEALAYSPVTHLFWTTTENMLKSDLENQHIVSADGLCLRIQSFTSELQPSLQYAYKTDIPQKSSSSCKFYCFAVPEIMALPDSSLLVMERELYIPHKYIGAFIINKIYRVFPNNSTAINSADSFDTLSTGRFMQKTLVSEFHTSLRNLSNYEGMCLGPKLSDGTQTILLICDSQNRYGNAFYHLKDRIRVLLIK